MSFQHQVPQFFNRAARHYEMYARLQAEVGEQLFERVQWLKMQPTCILDVGAGTGKLARRLSEQYPDATIYAVDIAQRMMYLAARYSKGLDRQHFICADAVRLPFADKSMDLVISNLMLQWCVDIDAVFKEFARVLQPQGALFFSTFGTDTLHELRHSWAAVDDKAHVNSFLDLHDIGDAMLRAGLTQPVVDKEYLQMGYTRVTELLRELKQIGSHNVMATRSAHLTGKNKFQAMVAVYETYRSPAGLLPTTFEVVYGHALGKSLRTPSTQKCRIAPL